VGKNLKKNINAALYMESKIVWKRGENIVATDPDGYLYAEGKRRTKILPEDLPEWFVYGYMYKRHGYVSAKALSTFFTFRIILFKIISTSMTLCLFRTMNRSSQPKKIMALNGTKATTMYLVVL